MSLTCSSCINMALLHMHNVGQQRIPFLPVRATTYSLPNQMQKPRFGSNAGNSDLKVSAVRSIAMLQGALNARTMRVAFYLQVVGL